MQGPAELSSMLFLQIRDLGTILTENRDIKKLSTLSVQKKLFLKISISCFLSTPRGSEIHVLPLTPDWATSRGNVTW